MGETCTREPSNTPGTSPDRCSGTRCATTPWRRIQLTGWISRPNRATGDRESFEPHPLTAEQIADVCAALRGERPGRDGKPLPALPVYALMVEFAAYTGLRASELAGLEIADLVFAPVRGWRATEVLSPR